MDIFEKLKTQPQTQQVPKQIDEDRFIVKNGLVYFVAEKQDNSKMPYYEQLPQKNGFFNRLRTKFFVKRILSGNKLTQKHTWGKLEKIKCLDFSWVSRRDKLRLFQNACRRRLGDKFATFLHKHHFDFDEVIRENTFADNFDDNIFSCKYIVQFLKDANVRDSVGNNLLVLCRSSREAYILISHGATFYGYTYDYMKTFSRITYQEDPRMEKLEDMFKGGVLGLSKTDVEQIMSGIGTNTPKLKELAIHLLGKEEFEIQKEYYQLPMRSRQFQSLDLFRERKKNQSRERISAKKPLTMQESEFSEEHIREEVDDIFEKAKEKIDE